MRRMSVLAAGLVLGSLAVSQVGRRVCAGDPPSSRVLSPADYRERFRSQADQTSLALV